MSEDSVTVEFSEYGGLRWFTDQHGPMLLADRLSWQRWPGPVPAFAAFDTPSARMGAISMDLYVVEFSGGAGGLCLGNYPGDSTAVSLAADLLVILRNIAMRSDSATDGDVRAAVDAISCGAIPSMVGSPSHSTGEIAFSPFNPDYPLVFAPGFEDGANVVRDDTVYVAMPTVASQYRVSSYWIQVAEGGQLRAHWDAPTDDDLYEGSRLLIHEVRAVENR